MPLEINRFTGTWAGASRLYMPWPPPGLEEESESTVEAEVAAGGLALSLRYTWVFQGKPQQGVMLVAVNAKDGSATAAWLDTFHQSAALMQLTGAHGAESVEVKASYEAPTGPPWGWIIRLHITPEDVLHLGMDNVTPDGEVAPAVRAEYRRQ